MSSRKSLNALAIILTAAGLALIGVATILMLQARPSSPPAGKAANGAAGLASAERAALTNGQPIRHLGPLARNAKLTSSHQSQLIRVGRTPRVCNLRA